MTKWILHGVFSVGLFGLCWRGLQWVSGAMWMAGLAGLDVLVIGMLTLFAGLFALLFGGWLARRVIRRDVEHGYL